MADIKRPVHRSLNERIVIEGTLVLKTPAQFGSGDAAPGTDMALIEDELDHSPLLPGPSIAGALRNYLTERELGYAALPEKKNGKPVAQRSPAAECLLGGNREDPKGLQSPLIVHDALGSKTERELRDGVRIDPETRTAKDEARYNMEVLSAGTRFNLRFELLISEQNAVERSRLLQALVTALHGLETGEITLGRRKRRGFGECCVEDWRIWDYQLHQTSDLLAWLAEDHPGWRPAPFAPEKPRSISEAFGGQVLLLDDARYRLVIQAHFALDNSLLIRSGFGEADQGPDVVHLHALRPGKDGQFSRQPILPGTSLAGALRARARRILLTLNPNALDRAMLALDALFGPENIDQGDTSTASRLETRESVISGGKRAVQNRIKIDRFTGGAYESALFSEEALFGANQSDMQLTIAIRNPSRAETGLALLLLKDLWTGDLPLGGGANIGRGRLVGSQGRILIGDECWEFSQDQQDHQDQLQFTSGQPTELEAYVADLVKEVGA